MASRKVQTALAIRTQITTMDKVRRELIRLRDIYLSSGYAPNGSNPITAADLLGHDMTPAQLLAVGSFLSAYETFVESYQESIDGFINPNGAQ